MYSAFAALCGLLVTGTAARPQGPPTQGFPQGPGGGSGGDQLGTSPEYTWLFENPLPIPPVAQPRYTENINGRKIHYFEITLEGFQHQVYPDLGPANLVGYSEYLSSHLSLRKPS